MKNKKVEKLKNKKTEDRKFHSTVWPFEIDQLEKWAFWDLAFTAEECKFLLLKLRSATYTGHEFETFYNIWVKVTKELEKLEK